MLYWLILTLIIYLWQLEFYAWFIGPQFFVTMFIPWDAKIWFFCFTKFTDATLTCTTVGVSSWLELYSYTELSDLSIKIYSPISFMFAFMGCRWLWKPYYRRDPLPQVLRSLIPEPPSSHLLLYLHHFLFRVHPWPCFMQVSYAFFLSFMYVLDASSILQDLICSTLVYSTGIVATLASVHLRGVFSFIG